MREARSAFEAMHSGNVSGKLVLVND